MSTTLSHADVARLLTNRSAESRVDLAEKIGSEIDSPRLAHHELELAQDIVRILSKDIEIGVRTALAASVRAARNLPRDVALRMAEDVETVALPIISHSLVLTDQDLIEIVRRSSEPKQIAVARRPTIAAPVSAALTEHGSESAIATLMGNEGATVPEFAFSRALDRFGRSEPVHEAMVRRSLLPAAVSERLVTLVSRRLQDVLVRNHDLPPAMAAELALTGRETAIIRLSAGADDEDLRQMIRQMHIAGRLTATLLMRALCTGDIALFEVGIAERAGISVENAQTLMADAGPNGLMALCRRAGIPPDIYPCIRAAVDTIAETGFTDEPHELERYRSRVIARVLTQVESFDPNEADYLMDKLGDALRLAA